MNNLIYDIPAQRRDIIAPLFAGMEDTTIYSALQGRNGGIARADSDTDPTAAMVLVGGFRPDSTGYGFLAGDAHSPAAKALALSAKELCGEFVILVPENDDWCAVIESAYGDRAKKGVRYATSKHEDHFDTAQLEVWANTLPEGYRLELMDASVFERFLAIGWAADNVANFESGETFEREGLGIMCLCGDEIVGAASSFTAYDKGIEIEIATAPAHRRRGIARACASRLLLECIARGSYPSWDAANTMSLGLARSLGYVYKGEYTAYDIEE